MATVESRPRLAHPAVDLAAVRVELERLYVEHSERVRAICASVLGNRPEAEDAAQQVFVSALRALRGGAVPRNAGAWLAMIARHESWARARCQPPGPLHDDLPDPAQEDPAATVVRRAELAGAWQTIAELPPAQREALLLREVRGLGYEELADDLRLSRASVRSLLSRARRTLRMQLEKGAAALTGPPWLNLLTRLFGDTSNPALSPASRTAAVGLGALAITGAAVVGPTAPPHRHPHSGARSTAGVHTRAASSGAIAGAAFRPAVATGAQLDRRGDRGATSGDQRSRGGGDDGGSSSPSGRDGGGSSRGSGPGLTSGSSNTTSGGSSPNSSSGGSGSGASESGPSTIVISSSSGHDGGGTSPIDGSGSSSGSGSSGGSGGSRGPDGFGSGGGGS